MGLIEYRQSLELSRDDPSIYALLMAAMRKADTNNTYKLKAMWPELYAEMQQRYNAPGGCINEGEMEWLTNLLKED